MKLLTDIIFSGMFKPDYQLPAKNISAKKHRRFFGLENTVHCSVFFQAHRPVKRLFYIKVKIKLVCIIVCFILFSNNSECFC